MPNYGEGFKGAAGGAMTGAALGSVVPGIGTAIGAGVGAIGGGLLGMMGGADEDQRRALEEYRRMVMQREAPQMGPASLASTSDFRTNQQGLISRLEALANGQGPSLANEQLRAATDRALQSQASIAQSGRGNAAFANMQAANNMQNIGQQAAQQSVIGRIGEEQMALNQLGGAINQGRGADESLSQFNAQQQNFNAQANLEAKLRAMGLNDQAVLNIMNQVGQLNARPTMADQLLAGGTGALGLMASQRAGANATQRMS